MVELIKSHLFKKISGTIEAVPIREDLKIHYENVTNMIRRLLQFGESNSLLIVGPEGSGKSYLINKAINANQDGEKEMLIVRLDGLLQTDDKIAMAEITRQLKLENVVEGRVFGSVAETLSFLLEALRSGSHLDSKPVLIIMENFDLFAAHKKQTLLYNLFDISQSAATPLTVIGCTRRLDVLELLEKRVKSRFCHRQIHIANEWAASDYVKALSNILTVGFMGVTKKSEAQKWNKNVETLLKNEHVVEMVHKLFTISKEIPLLLDLLIQPVSRLCRTSHDAITPADIYDSYQSLVCAEPKAKLLHGLSIIELCLVIATRHLCSHSQVSLTAPTFNFHEIYNEFCNFSSKKSHLLHNCNRHVVMKAFEHLLELEIIRPFKCSFGGRSKENVSKDYVPMMLLVSGRQVDEAVSKYPNCPTDVQKWAESSIM